MQVTVNGKPEIIDFCTISQYVAAKGLNPESLVVEYNRQIIQQERWEAVWLQANDTLELLSFVGGG